jgi:hypothetical protein
MLVVHDSVKLDITVNSKIKPLSLKTFSVMEVEHALSTEQSVLINEYTGLSDSGRNQSCLSSP